ncbi:pyridoxamine 5'-phosphate oxidase [Deltaproteobacteria bacterium Smac51]|nr:pyridoxamine 5'-phosphate oxidase [Deltaproteobacteria bacterium Smac51]
MPISIPMELKEFISGRTAWVATADSSGQPNVAPKGTLKVIDDQTLAFADLFSVKTRQALEENGKISVAVIESGKPIGYQFKGTAELLNTGPLFEDFCENLKKAGMPAPAYVTKITVEEIYNLAPGPEAGKKIL